MDFKNTIWNCSEWTDEMMCKWQKRCIELGWRWPYCTSPVHVDRKRYTYIDASGYLGTIGYVLSGFTEMRYEDMFPAIEVPEQGIHCHIHRKTLEFIAVTPEGSWLLRTNGGDYAEYHPEDVKIGKYRTEDQKRTDAIVSILDEHLPDIEEGIKVDIALHLNLEGLLK